MIPLVKDYLISQGKPALGFLNPWVCGGDLALGFNDITSGSNPGCITDGFLAIAGWDLVRPAGLASIHFRRFADSGLL